MPYRDDDNDELDPREFPDPDDNDHDVGIERCPRCSQWIYENAERCPTCGYYLTAEDDTPTQRPWWVVLAAVLLLLFILWFWI